MNKENDIRVKMVRMVGDIAPFVQVDYMDKDAQEHTGLMLLDSGSTANILSSEMADCIGLLCKLEDKETISSISDEILDFEKVNFSFALGGTQFHDTYCISRIPLPIQVKGMECVGVLGNNFLQKHHLVIDYRDHSLHTSAVSHKNLSISDCDFFFPMNIGLEFYGLPVVSVKQKGKELVTLIDTGSTTNMIAKNALSVNRFRCRYTDEKSLLTNIMGNIIVDNAIVWFKMMSLDSNDVCEIPRHEHFAVLPTNVANYKERAYDTNGEQLPPIEVLLGAPFIAKEGWILDFGAKIMYKLKVA